MGKHVSKMRGNPWVENEMVKIDKKVKNGRGTSKIQICLLFTIWNDYGIFFSLLKEIMADERSAKDKAHPLDKNVANFGWDKNFAKSVFIMWTWNFQGM